MIYLACWLFAGIGIGVAMALVFGGRRAVKRALTQNQRALEDWERRCDELIRDANERTALAELNKTLKEKSDAE